MGKLNYIRNSKVGASTQDLEALKTKVDNLSNITVKNNLTNQIIPQQKINQAPTQPENIIRLHDTQYVRIVNQTSAVNANTVLTWSMTNQIVNQKIHNFVIKCSINNVDYLFNVSGWIQDRNYKNVFPTFSFANGDNLTETAKIKFWIHENKVRIYSSVALTTVQVYLRIENHR